MIRYGQGPGKRHQAPKHQEAIDLTQFFHGDTMGGSPTRNGYGFAGRWSMSPLDVMFNGTNGDPSRRKENSPGNPSTRHWESSAASPPQRSRRTVPRREPACHRNVGPISLSSLLGVMPTARNAP